MTQGKKGPKPSGSNPADKNERPADDLSVGDWTGRKRPAYRKFPGPKMADAALRIAMDREPFAEITSHTKKSLDREVCGVLVGDSCEDDEGPFIHIRAVIRGLAAREASTHVTYTQETWNQIHETMDSRYPKMQIVGWYHSHPGYGVEFSEMDVFIQTNFFSAPTQVGLVTDPLGGQTAVCMNAGGGVEYVSRIWVDGREQKCVTPRKAAATDSAPETAGTASDERLEAVERRLNQTLRALDDLRMTVHRFLFGAGILIAAAVILWIGFSIYNGYTNPNHPPELNEYAQIPVKIGDKVALLGVQVVSWDIPPSLIPKPAPDNKDQNSQPAAEPSASPATTPQGQPNPAPSSSQALPSPSPAGAANPAADNGANSGTAGHGTSSSPGANNANAATKAK